MTDDSTQLDRTDDVAEAPTATTTARPPAPQRAERSQPEPIDSSISLLVSTLTFLGRIFGQVVSRVRLEGAVDEIPTDGPVILAANHSSNLDAVVIGSWIIPKLGRRIHWLGKKELFAWPVVGLGRGERRRPSRRS